MAIAAWNRHAWVNALDTLETSVYSQYQSGRLPRGLGLKMKQMIIVVIFLSLGSCVCIAIALGKCILIYTGSDFYSAIFQFGFSFLLSLFVSHFIVEKYVKVLLDF